MPLPFLIGGTGAGTLGAFSGVQHGSVTRANGEVWQFVSQPSPHSLTMGAYLLDSGGRSYTLYDADNGPDTQHCPMYWDGCSNLVYFLWDDTEATAIRAFDLDDRTWQPDFADSGYPDASTYLPDSLWQRSDGSFLAIYLQTGDNRYYWYDTFSEGTWATIAELTFNAHTEYPLLSFENISTILDSSDRLHCTFQAGPSPNKFFYQQLAADATLSTYQEFDQTGSPENLYVGATSSTMVITGDTLLWGVIRNGTDANIGAYQFPAVAIGAGLAAPSWTFTDSIDPNQYADVPGPPYPLPQNPTTFPALFLQGGILFAIYIRSVYTGGVFPLNEGGINISQTTDSGFTTGWTSAPYYDPNAVPLLFPSGDIAFGFTPLMSFTPDGVSNGVSVDYTDTSSDDPLEQRYWFAAASGAFGNIFGYMVNMVRR